MPEPAYALVTTLACIAANRTDADPCWIMLVGGPSSGKTETLMALQQFPDVAVRATVTAAGLLSGTPSKERSRVATGGLLQELGDRGILVIKDFGTMLTGNRSARSEVVQALRDVYDGHWARALGTDGGMTLEWHGHLGLVAAATSEIDNYYAVMADLGDRFVYLRLDKADGIEQSRQARSVAGHESEMRDALAQAVADVVAAVDPCWFTRQPEPDKEVYLDQLANFVTLSRSAVTRDGYSREITNIHYREMPARFVKQLLQMWRGLRSIGVGEDFAWRVVTRLGIDSVQPGRITVLRGLLEVGEPIGVTALAELVEQPVITVTRALEELQPRQIVQRSGGRWSISLAWAEVIPEMFNT